MKPVGASPSFDELEDRILPWSQVKVICGLSRTTVWRMQRTGDFPASVQVSHNRVGWWQSELLTWKRARTPRRLPEPRQIPVTPVVSAVVTRELTGETLKAGEPVVAVAVEPVSIGRKKRKITVAENQTAFDF